LYVGDNPNIYIDPSGMRRFSYLFYFPGVGNDGTSYSKKETDFLDYLEGESLYFIITEKIYPYGVGLVKQGENTRLVMLSETSGSEHDVSEAKAEEILRIWRFE
jgi:hypothetical protein